MSIEYAEAACITAALSDPNLDLSLTPEDFLTEDSRLIWTAITNAGREIPDVADWLSQKTGKDWMPRILETVDGGFGTTNAAQWAEKLRDYHRHRDASRAAQRLLTALQAGEGDSAITEALKALNNLTARSSSGMTLAEAAKSAVESAKSGKSGVESGITRLDRNTGGFNAGDLIVVGARTGVGKTALMMQFAVHAAANNIPVGIMSGEQCAAQIGLRALAHIGAATVSDIRCRRASWDSLDYATTQLNDYPCWINDTSGPSLSTVQQAARMFHREHGIRILFVDYLQRMSGDKSMPEHERVGENAKGLKTLATELNIPIVALAQLNRQADGTTPKISQLKDSGRIEQEADQIYLLHCENPDYAAERYEVKLSLEKNRHGPVMFFRLMWQRAQMRYTEIEP